MLQNPRLTRQYKLTPGAIHYGASELPFVKLKYIHGVAASGQQHGSEKHICSPEVLIIHEKLPTML